jgi:ABC-2 type transport system permease protein
MTPDRKISEGPVSGQQAPGRLRPYLSAFRIRLQQNLQYRVAAFAGMATQLFWGLMLIMVLEAFYQSSDADLPMTLSQLAAYIWLQQSFLVFIALWYRDGDIFGMITSGQVAYELCRPTNLYYFWHVRLLAQRLAGALLRCFPILLLAFILPDPYRMTLPPTLPAFLLFCLTLLTGLLVNVSISMFIYILTFVTLSPVGSLLLIGVIGEFCAGMIIPIPLMPDWLQTLLFLLPFRLTADLPFRIWSGHIPLQSALSGWVWQLVWLAALIVTGRLAMRKVLLRLVVQGG